MPLVSLIVRLVDEVSSVAPKVVNAVKGIEGAATAGAPAAEKFDKIGTSIAGVGLGLAGLWAASVNLGNNLQGNVKRGAAFEDMLEGIARTGELADGQLASLRDTILKLGPQLGRTPSQIGEVANSLVAAGIAPDRVEKMLEPIGRVAVATRSGIADISKAAQAMFQNLEIDADRLESTFDKVWLAAKRGNFELKDMAQYLPAIAAAASSRGMKGEAAAVEIAAAAQIVREGAGSPGQAATNLKDLLLKTSAPQTVKAFSKVGIDIKDAIEKGMAQGQSPLETVILQTKKALAENSGLTVGDLFHDQQAQLALAKLIEKYEEFVKIRREAMAAGGTIGTDYAAMSETELAALNRLDAAIDARQKKWAKASAGMSIWRSNLLAGLNTWVGNLADRFPRLSRAIAGVSMALADVVPMATQLGQPLLALASTMMIGKFLGLGKVVGGIGRILLLALLPLRFLASGIGRMLVSLATTLGPMLFGAIMALGPIIMKAVAGLIALLSNPIGWAVLAAAVAAALIYYFREPIAEGFAQITEWIKTKWAELTAWFSGIDVSGFFAAGSKIITSLWEGMKSIAQQLLGWAGGLVGKLKSLFSFSVSPSVGGAPTGSTGGGAPVLQKQSAVGGLTPAPGLARQANMTFNNNFTISGSDNPESVARRIVAALDRQRQAGMYDGALA
jgi:TP901 family phage tail tape measure protein